MTNQRSRKFNHWWYHDILRLFFCVVLPGVFYNYFFVGAIQVPAEEALLHLVTLPDEVDAQQGEEATPGGWETSSTTPDSPAFQVNEAKLMVIMRNK